MLNLIEKDFLENKISLVRLDGSMSQRKRSKVLKKFEVEKNITVFLISLKAGGVGLNLVAANHVFLVDPWWNPAIEEQAIQRVHRIGQTKDVFVTRLICNKSIEQRVLQLHERKKQLFDNTISPDQKKKISAEDFKFLMQKY